MAVQQGRSTRRGEAYALQYVEPLSAARTPLADFFSILLETPGQVFQSHILQVEESHEARRAMAFRP